MAALTESTVEDATLAWLEPTGWRIGCAGLGVALYDDRRGIIETWGRGTLKIARLMQERGLEPPAMVVREGAVVVTFRLPAPVETTGKAIGKTTGKTPLAVLRLLADDPSLTVPQLAARLEKSEPTIHRAIRTLRESGRLQRIGPDKGGHWQVIG